MHSKNIDKCGENPQSACRKSDYHTKYGKNCHKILSVKVEEDLFASYTFYKITDSARIGCL